MMSLSFPDWMPVWGQLLVLAFGVLFGLAFMMMPFAVFGVKGRLGEISLQLEEIQAELRAQAVRGAPAYQEPTLSGMAERSGSTSSGVVVEEVRPPEVEKPPAAPRAVPVFPELRTPKVSDAYEAREEAPPTPHLAPDPAKPVVRRMPCHEPEAPRAETGAEILRRQRAPDANQPPYRPDFSHEAPQPHPSVRIPRIDEHTGRAEPVLNWPRKNPAND